MLYFCSERWIGFAFRGVTCPKSALNSNKPQRQNLVIEKQLLTSEVYSFISSWKLQSIFVYWQIDIRRQLGVVSLGQHSLYKEKEKVWGAQRSKAEELEADSTPIQTKLGAVIMETSAEERSGLSILSLWHWAQTGWAGGPEGLRPGGCGWEGWGHPVRNCALRLMAQQLEKAGSGGQLMAGSHQLLFHKPAGVMLHIPAVGTIKSLVLASKISIPGDSRHSHKPLTWNKQHVGNIWQV